MKQSKWSNYRHNRNKSPSAWNDIKDEAKNTNSSTDFKTKLQTEKSENEIFCYGHRKQQIILGRLRRRCSNLNEDKFDICRRRRLPYVLLQGRG